MIPRILIIGNTYLETVLQVTGMPMQGYTEEATAYREGIGGRGAASALCACRLGLGAILSGRAGEDTTGKRIRDFLRAGGVDTRFFYMTRKHKTAVNTIIQEGQGESSIYYPGASARLSMKDVENAFTSNPDAVYLHFDVSYEVAVSSARFAKMKGIPLFLSASPVSRDFPFDLLEGVNTVFLDEEEVFRYTHVRADSMEGCMKAAVLFQNKTGAESVVIKRREKGVFISYGKYYKAIQAYTIKPVDYAYSDAAFDIAFIGDYLKRKLFDHACEYANIVGTLTAAVQGGLDSVPEKETIVKFAKANCPELFLNEQRKPNDPHELF